MPPKHSGDVVVSKADCKKWFDNQLINPKTGRKIKLDGPTYLNLKKKCIVVGVVGEPSVATSTPSGSPRPRPRTTKGRKGMRPKAVPSPVAAVSDAQVVSPAVGLSKLLCRKSEEIRKLSEEMKKDCDDRSLTTGSAAVNNAMMICGKAEEIRKLSEEMKKDCDDRITNRIESIPNASSPPHPPSRPIQTPGRSSTSGSRKTDRRPLRGSGTSPLGPPSEPRRVDISSSSSSSMVSWSEFMKETPPPMQPLAPPPIQHEIIEDRRWLSNREKLYKQVNEEIRKIDADQWDMCMTGLHSKFRESLKDTLKIGAGSFGEVYRAYVGAERLALVIKEAYLTDKEELKLKASVGRHVKYGQINQNSYPMEYLFLHEINKLLRLNQTPNFLYTYGISVCEGCYLRDKPSGACYVTYMEPADGDLSIFLQAYTFDFDDYLSLMQQLLLAAFTMHAEFGFWHRDIKQQNILMKKIPSGGYFQYVLGPKTYYVKNRGFIAFIADFGIAIPTRPVVMLDAYQKYFGTRSAEVAVDPDSNELYCRPIRSEYGVKPEDEEDVNNENFVRVDDPESYTWTNEKTKQQIEGTENLFVKGINIGPNIYVDLTDMLRFPAFEFFDDIQDIMRMFVGGPRTVIQHYYHPGLPNLPNKLKVHIDQFIRYIVPHFLYFSVKFVRADVMLDHFYDAKLKVAIFADAKNHVIASSDIVSKYVILNRARFSTLRRLRPSD